MTSKRIFDLLFSSIVLLISGWFILILYFIAYIDSGTNGLFTQLRVGRYGKVFRIYKITTIHKKTGTISRWGRFLRKYKLDELPQFFNILIGDMSIVGPRPDIPGYYDTLEGEARLILNLKPGLTSPASLKYFDEDRILSLQADPLAYNDAVIFPDKVRMNLEYYRTKSFLGDLKIIWRTIFRKNADLL